MRFPRITPSEWLLRIAIAFSFLFPPVDAISDPYSWVGYFPAFLTDLVAPHSVLLLHAFGIVEVALAVWLIVGRRVRLPAFICAILLILIVLMNGPQFPVLFRDLSIALAALALAFWPRRVKVTAVERDVHVTSVETDGAA